MSLQGLVHVHEMLVLVVSYAQKACKYDQAMQQSNTVEEGTKNNKSHLL